MRREVHVKKVNKILNFADFAVVTATILLFIILSSASSCFDKGPFMATLFLLQPASLYFFLRIRFSIQLPLLWCWSCTEQGHMRYHLCTGLFAGFVVFCDLLDIIRSLFMHTGLLQADKALFVLEFFSLAAAIAVFVIIWKFPWLVLSDRAME